MVVLLLIAPHAAGLCWLLRLAPLNFMHPRIAPLAAIANTSAGTRVEMAAFRRRGAALVKTGDGDGIRGDEPGRCAGGMCWVTHAWYNPRCTRRCWWRS
ncbi:hypothetical protein IG631_07291 [Alternaria alternata]|nr:hypothetical protein IG631_07291 [Alternaria alternata]